METCENCGNIFKNKRGIASHYRHKIECREFYTNKRKEELLNRGPHIICKVCGKSFRSITNTHLKSHNMTQNQYSNFYGSIFADGLLDIQKQNREKTLATRYSKSELKFLRGEKSINVKREKYGSLSAISKNARDRDPEKFKLAAEKTRQGLKKFYEDIKQDACRHNEHKLKRLQKRKNTNKAKYNIEFTQQLDSVKNKQKETLIKKYGTLENAYRCIAQRGAETKKKLYGKYCNFFPNFSLDSQKLFKEIETLLKNKKYKFTIYYATNGDDTKSNEYQILTTKGNIRYLDFYIKELNFVIEFNEEYHLYSKQTKKDKFRDKQLLESLSGLILIKVQNSDYFNNPNKCIDDIINEIEQRIERNKNE